MWLLLPLIFTTECHGYLLLRPQVHKYASFGCASLRIRRQSVDVSPVSSIAVMGSMINDLEAKNEEKRVERESISGDELNVTSTANETVENATMIVNQTVSSSDVDGEIDGVPAAFKAENQRIRKRDKRVHDVNATNHVLSFFENLFKHHKSVERRETRGTLLSPKNATTAANDIEAMNEENRVESVSGNELNVTNVAVDTAENVTVANETLSSTDDVDDEMDGVMAPFKAKKQRIRKQNKRRNHTLNDKNPVLSFFENLVKYLKGKEQTNGTATTAMHDLDAMNEKNQVEKVSMSGGVLNATTRSTDETADNATMIVNETLLSPSDVDAVDGAVAPRSVKARKQRLRKQKRKNSRRNHAANALNPFLSFFENLFKHKHADRSKETNGSWWWQKNVNATAIRASSPMARENQTRSHLHFDIIHPIWFFQRLVHRNATSSSTNTTKASTTNTNRTESLAAYSWDSTGKTFDTPVGDRWAISARHVNLSGTWKPIITPAFKKEYEEYLQNCGQSLAFRTLCLSFVGTTREVIDQDGNTLQIRGTNPVGVWQRTLVASGSDLIHSEYTPFNVSFLDPDRDEVHVEAWWQDEGTVHKSWLRGKRRVNGGEFESTRYLDENGELVCESVFHPNGGNKGRFRPANVTWRFEREDV